MIDCSLLDGTAKGTTYGYHVQVLNPHGLFLFENCSAACRSKLTGLGRQCTVEKTYDKRMHLTWFTPS